LLDKHPQQDAALVYDLRHDPTPFLEMDVDQLVEAWKFTKDPDVLRLPVKTLKYNRCPAVAPLGVMKDETTQDRLDLTLETIAKHLAILKQHQAAFAKKVAQAIDKLDDERAKAQTSLVDNQLTVDKRLYEKFIDSQDKQTMRAVRAAKPPELGELASNFHDERLKSLLPLYKARNYPGSLDDDERTAWEKFCAQRLFDGGQSSRLAKYFARLSELSEGKLTGEQQYLLEELQLYGQSIVPTDAAN
jgi:exodeoxyribonuclease-1